MERVAIIAHLKEGREQLVAELVGAGLPFDLTDTGIVRHSVYVSATRSCSCSRATRSSGSSTS